MKDSSSKKSAQELFKDIRIKITDKIKATLEQ